MQSKVWILITIYEADEYDLDDYQNLNMFEKIGPFLLKIQTHLPIIINIKGNRLYVTKTWILVFSVWKKIKMTMMKKKSQYDIWKKKNGSFPLRYRLVNNERK